MVNPDKTLKYLGFVHVAAVSVASWLFCLYEFVKENSGPFEDIIEGIEETIVGPVYQKFSHVVVEMVNLVDLKMDEYALQLHRRLPPVVHQVSSQSLSAAQTVVSEVNRLGAVGAASAKVEQLGIKAVAKLIQLPLISQVAEVLLPTVGYCLEKYNDTVSRSADKGYKISNYLPLVPTEKIAKVVGADSAVRVWRTFFRSPGIRFTRENVYYLLSVQRQYCDERIQN